MYFTNELYLSSFIFVRDFSPSKTFFSVHNGRKVNFLQCLFGAEDESPEGIFVSPTVVIA